MGFNLGFKGLKAELNPICHLLALLGVHLIFHISRIRVNGIVHSHKKTEKVFLFLFLTTRDVRWIFRKLEGVLGTGWSWLRIGTGGGHLWVR